MAVPKPVIPQDPKVLNINVSKYVYAAGVLAGTCYGSYKRINNKTEVKRAVPVPLKARGAAA